MRLKALNTVSISAVKYKAVSSRFVHLMTLPNHHPNMDPFEGIDVEIVSNRGVLTLYNDPDDEPSHDSRVRQQYIEAVTGAIFEVKVRVDRRFSLFSLGENDAVRATVCYDSTHRYGKNMLIDPLLHNSTSGRSISCTFTRMHNFCPETRKWKSGATTFGALVTSEPEYAPISSKHF